MYAHHAESLQNMIDYFSGREEIIALVFGGSVAKGCERPDSDLDAMVVVTDEYYAQREKENRVTETISGYCTYEGGYFDVKYMTKAFIAAAADHASEPTRNSFIGARVLFSRDPEIPGIVARIPVFQKQERADKELSFFANLMLNYHYFWKACEPDGYMRLHVAGQIVYSIYRMILQENEILFPCNRRLEETVEAAPHKPEHIVELGRKAADTLADEDLEAFAKAYFDWTTWQFPTEHSVILARYVEDFEQWWYQPRPLVGEW